MGRRLRFDWHGRLQTPARCRCRLQCSAFVLTDAHGLETMVVACWQTTNDDDALAEQLLATSWGLAPRPGLARQG